MASYPNITYTHSYPGKTLLHIQISYAYVPQYILSNIPFLCVSTSQYSTPQYPLYFNITQINTHTHTPSYLSQYKRPPYPNITHTLSYPSIAHLHTQYNSHPYPNITYPYIPVYPM